MALLRHSVVSVFLLVLFASCGVSNRTTRSSSDSGTATSPTRSRPSNESVISLESGVPSWYGPDFHGRQTANGEKYDMNAMTAAHRTLPFNTMVLVENLDNGRSVKVRINDRGPFAKGRIIDLSKAAAEKMDMIGPGTARVRVYILNEGDLPPSVKPQYTVQLGSYSDKEAAEKKAAEIRSSYVKEVEVDGETFYRIYFGDFEDPSIAMEALQRLQGLGHDGFVKLLNGK